MATIRPAPGGRGLPEGTVRLRLEAVEFMVGQVDVGGRPMAKFGMLLETDLGPFLVQIPVMKVRAVANNMIRALERGACQPDWEGRP
ncbi:hypothetical protein AWC15_06590 [Mycobacterium lacus]|nr:hypothetical protein AWC15_06590 [Mycobacterium lacus]